MSEFTENLMRVALIGTIPDLRASIREAVMLIDGQRTDLAEYESQLDAQSAYIEELTEALYLALPYVECYEGDDDFKQDKIKRDSKLIRNVLSSQSPTTSLEQVKREKVFHYDYHDIFYTDESIATKTDDQDIIAYYYSVTGALMTIRRGSAYGEILLNHVNNLKEKGL